MSTTYRFLALMTLVMTTIACGLISQATPPTQTAIPLSPPSSTPAFTATIAPSDTPIPTATMQPSGTPAPETATMIAFVAQQTQMVGTAVIEFGPMAHLSGYMIFYSNPIGTPVESWHDVPIMKEATAGQEFQTDIYSYKAAATLQQASAFYSKQVTSLNWSCFPMATGYGGSGSQATHDATLICGPLAIVMTSYDNDQSQVLVVINKAP